MMDLLLGYKITFIDDQAGHSMRTNGPERGIIRCEHIASRTAVEVHTRQARSSHRARELAVTLCGMAVEELGIQ